MSGFVGEFLFVLLTGWIVEISLDSIEMRREVGFVLVGTPNEVSSNKNRVDGEVRTVPDHKVALVGEANMRQQIDEVTIANDEQRVVPKPPAATVRFHG